MTEAASLMISRNMDHLEQALRASTEANNRQADRPDGWDDRPYIPGHVAEPAVGLADTPTEAPPRGEVQESQELPRPSTERAETQGAENNQQDDQVAIDMEDVDDDLEDVDAISITTLSDIDPEELDE